MGTDAVWFFVLVDLVVLNLEELEDAEDSREVEVERLLDIMSEPEIYLEDRELTIDAAHVPPNVILSKADIDGGLQMPRQDEDSIHQTIMKQTIAHARENGVPEEALEMLMTLWNQKLKLSPSQLDEELVAKHDQEDADADDEEDEVIAGPSSGPLEPSSAEAGGSQIRKRKRVLKKKVSKKMLPQVDGPNDSSDDDDDDDDDDDRDLDGIDDDDDGEDGADEEPLGSNDDISDEDPSDLFNTANVVVCQWDKIGRARNKWKFHLKDGIMNLNGKDYVFQKAIGEAEW